MDKQTWRAKINRGRYVERQILSWIKKNYDAKAFLPEKHLAEYDIESKVMGNIEIKEDRMAHGTGNYAIELVDGHNKKSGLGITTAKFFVIVDLEYVILIPTESLKFVVDNCIKKKMVKMGDKFKHGEKSVGWLLPRDVLLTSPFAQVIKRWFPYLEDHGR